MRADQVPEAVRRYAERLAAALRAAAGDGAVLAVYVHGSAALGGWVRRRSDVDVLVIAGRPGTAAAAAAGAMARALAAAGAGCPGRGLEASVVTPAAARAPAPPWPYLRHVTAGPGQPARIVVPGRAAEGDPDLLMHYAVCRAVGWAAWGPPAGELIGAVPRAAVLRYLAGELAWGAEHATESYAVLNACRALAYLDGGEIVSKVAGGQAALARGAGPPGVIAGALRQQLGRQRDQPPAAAAAGFARAVAARLREAACAGEQPC